jgi:homoserine kinase
VTAARWTDATITVRAPATSANLGPGFDALGLALTLYDTVTAQIIGGGLAIEVTGCGEETQDAGEAHLVIRAMRAAFDAAGQQPPGLAISCHNSIPHGFGLGSSAAAIVAGLLAARALASPPGEDPAKGPGAPGGPLDDDALLRLATRLEGHPDNVAACLLGGLTIAWLTAANGTGAPEPRAVRLAPVTGLAPVVCVPLNPVATSVARLALPESVPHADAAQNSARAALLIAALTGGSDALLEATEDYLHQRYRAGAMPGTAALTGALRAAGIPAVVSGAGPSVLALTVAGTRPGADEAAAIAGAQAGPWQVLPLAADLTGAAVVGLPEPEPGLPEPGTGLAGPGVPAARPPREGTGPPGPCWPPGQAATAAAAVAGSRASSST